MQFGYINKTSLACYRNKISLKLTGYRLMFIMFAFLILLCTVYGMHVLPVNTIQIIKGLNNSYKLQALSTLFIYARYTKIIYSSEIIELTTRRIHICQKKGVKRLKYSHLQNLAINLSIIIILF